jgi:hypothetical protein
MPGRRADGEDERASADQLIGTCCGTPTLCTRGTKHNRPTIHKAIDQHETRNSSVWVLIVPPGLDIIWSAAAKACASSLVMGGGERGLPSGVGPGAAEQPTTDNDGAGQRQPELHQVLPGSVHRAACRPGSLRHGCALSRHRRPASTAAGAQDGDLADHPAATQDLPTRRIVVAGVQMHNRGRIVFRQAVVLRFGTPRTPPIAAGAASYAGQAVGPHRLLALAFPSLCSRRFQTCPTVDGVPQANRRPRSSASCWLPP